jgi:hypothetical protein
MTARLFALTYARWFCCALQSMATEPGSSAPKSAAVMDFELIDQMRD